MSILYMIVNISEISHFKAEIERNHIRANFGAYI